jgi:DNA-binding response OmpR family regulator
MTSREEPPKETNSSGRTLPRILHVEDSPDMQSLTEFVLTDYDLTTVETFERGLEAARTGGFDLIILDHYLPDGNGIKLCSLIRTFDERTPILFVTNAHEIGLEEIRAVGASAIVRKMGSGFIDKLLRSVRELTAQ